MFVLPLVTLIACVLLLTAGGAGSFTWTAGLAACLLAAVAMTVIRGRHVFPISRKQNKALPGVDMSVMIALVLITLTVLPLSLKMSAMSGPGFFQQNQAVDKAVTQAAELDLAEPFQPRYCYSRNRIGTQRIAIILVLAFLSASLSAHFSVKQKESYLLFLAFLGSALAVSGILSLTRFPQGDTLWWRIPIKHGLPGPVACFVNRNYFAGCMTILSASTGGLLWHSCVHRRWGHALISAISLALMGSGLVMALSRGAIIAYAAAATFFLVLLFLRRQLITAIVLLIVVIASCTMVMRSAEHDTRERLQSLKDPLQTASAKSRVNMWTDAIGIWSAHPTAGVGMDGFRMIYPQHRTTSRSGFASHAENIYVQVLCETGLIGVTLIFLLSIAIIRLLRSPSIDHAATRPFLPASAAAVIAAGAHSMFDSPLLIPMNAMLTASILGLSLSIEEGISKPAHVSTRPYTVTYASVIALIFGLLCIPMHRTDSIRFCRTASAEQLVRALPAAPSSWMHWYYLGRQACLTRTPAGRKFGEHCISRAAELDPNNYKIWRELGILRLRLDNHAGAATAFRRVRELGRHWVNLPAVPGYDYETTPEKGDNGT
ncbi:MAG: O-antigen ligase family protein [Kiritimatiellae bacterium]|nr:O-antigen ligase family protein [Kiritimatiellia bacterium]